jgi:ABC-2 type transport system ATP-binding protein
VRGPQVGRLADLLVASGAAVRQESGVRISVIGASRTEIGELAYRHGILLHELADQAIEDPPLSEALFPVSAVAAQAREAARVPVGATSAAAHADGPATGATPAARTAATARAYTGSSAAGTTSASAASAPVTVSVADSGAAQAAGSGETVVLLTPGVAVAATVNVPASGRTRTQPGLASVSGPLYRDESALPADLRSE